MGKAVGTISLISEQAVKQTCKELRKMLNIEYKNGHKFFPSLHPCHFNVKLQFASRGRAYFSIWLPV